MTDGDVVLLLSLVRELNVVALVLCEEIPFVFAPVTVGAVILTPPGSSEASFGLMPPTTTAFVLEYKGVVEVENKASLVVGVE